MSKKLEENRNLIEDSRPIDLLHITAEVCKIYIFYFNILITVKKGVLLISIIQSRSQVNWEFFSNILQVFLKYCFNIFL